MSMKIITANQLQNEKRASMEIDPKIDETVLNIIGNVRKSGDEVLYRYTKELDKVALTQLKVTDSEIEEALKSVTPTFIEALKRAEQNIIEFHEMQKEKSWYYIRENGAFLGQQVTAIDRIGVYIPGGKAAYPSTVLMNVIPAKIAGVESITITTPPQADGTINPHVLVAAKIAGADTIFKLGGAQAIAALAYGTRTIEKVDKIVGPGNAYVARAKKWVYGDVDIDMIAGPSEICVVADEQAPINYVAADLLSQAEHDEDAEAICITFSKKLATEIQQEVDKQLAKLERKDIAEASIINNGKIIVVDDIDEAFQVVNTISPEHLQIMTENPKDHLTKVKHAGAIFLGLYSPEPLGDYMAGPNHTLPTSGTARFSSPLGVYDFQKKSSIIAYTEDSLEEEAKAIELLANTEELTGHEQSIYKRRKDF